MKPFRLSLSLLLALAPCAHAVDVFVSHGRMPIRLQKYFPKSREEQRRIPLE